MTERPSTKIFLVGFMGTGKTTLGRLLAERLGWEFRDIDLAIEEEEGASVLRIFIEKGEQSFRRLEQRTLERLADESGPAVVACGGGTFCGGENQALMLRRGLTIWVDQPFDQVWGRRDELAGRRPLLRGEREVRELYEARAAHYRLAVLHLPVEEGKLTQALETLLGILREKHGIH